MADVWDEAMAADYAAYMESQGQPVATKTKSASRRRTSKPKKRTVRFARVPAGVETCQFCVMLASRGFVYNSEVNASHSHSHCDCVVTPGFANETVVEDYYPEELYDQYLEARKSVEAMFTPQDWEYVGGATRTKLIIQEMRRQAKEAADYSDSFNGTGKVSGLNIKGVTKPETFLIDDYLVGLYGEPEPMTFEQADGNRVNPTNDTRNCQTCAASYEMRCRGYNVEALPRVDNDIMDKLAKNPTIIWKDKENFEPVKYSDLSAYDAKTGVKFLESKVHQGERFTMAYVHQEGGHVVSVQRNISGKLMIYDPQNGKIYTGEEIEQFMKRTVEIRYLFRVDDAILNIDMAKELFKVVD